MSDFVKQFLVLKAFWTFHIFTVPQEPMKFSKKIVNMKIYETQRY